MLGRTRPHAPVRLFVWFAILAGAPLAALGWLGWRLLAQERALDEQRLRNEIDNAGALIVRDLQRSLADWDGRLTSLARGETVALPPDVVALILDGRGVVRRRGPALPYYPAVSPPLEAHPDLFADIEAIEFVRGDLAQAERLYRQRAAASDRPTRAAALMRLARCLRKEGRILETMGVYDDLISLGADAWIAGSPAGLVARHERVALLADLGERERAGDEAKRLADDLWSGRFAIDRVTFEFFLNGARLQATAGPADQLARGLDAMWSSVTRQAEGRTAVNVDGASFVGMWNRTDAASVVVLGRRDVMTPGAGFARPGFRATFEDTSGEAPWPTTREGPSVTKTARETGLPWTVRVAAADVGAAQQLRRSRANLLLAGFTLMALVIVTAGVVVFRAVGRDLAVARLQSEFVATVSHEFRSPLTAMRHLTELLDEGHAPAPRIPQYYRALVKETRRLESLVESLLDFGRMEAGRRTYRMETTSATDVARLVIEEFADSPGADRLEWDAATQADEPATIRADRQAIGLALRNLVDNALKYSPPSAHVRVCVRLEGGDANISVTDSGPGMSADEQRDIFRKFVRGSAAAALDVKGTGIGLAIAEHIVHAHGGRLRVDSQPGRGSCFTIMLPRIVEAA